MQSFEKEMKQFLDKLNLPYEDNREANNMPDFSIWIADKIFRLEVKEKRRRTKLGNWPAVRTPEEFLFLIDELTARRVLCYAPAAGVILRDNNHRRYVFVHVVNLWTQPRVRVNRKVSDTHMKGKWMLDMRNNVVTKSLDVAMRAVCEFAEKLDAIASVPGCLGHYVDEQIPIGGEYRTKAMKEYDYQVTR